MGALGAEDTSDKLGTMVVGDCGREVGVGLSTKERDKGWDLCTSVFVFRVTSSSVRLVFLTTLTCETECNIWYLATSPSYKSFSANVTSDSFWPDSSSEERIKRIQPVMHLFVISGLKQYSTVFCTHGECVGGLLKEPKELIHQ